MVYVFIKRRVSIRTNHSKKKKEPKKDFHQFIQSFDTTFIKYTTKNITLISTILLNCEPTPTKYSTFKKPIQYKR